MRTRLCTGQERARLVWTAIAVACLLMAAYCVWAPSSQDDNYSQQRQQSLRPRTNAILSNRQLSSSERSRANGREPTPSPRAVAQAEMETQTGRGDTTRGNSETVRNDNSDAVEPDPEMDTPETFPGEPEPAEANRKEEATAAAAEARAEWMEASSEPTPSPVVVTRKQEGTAASQSARAQQAGLVPTKPPAMGRDFTEETGNTGRATPATNNGAVPETANEAAMERATPNDSTGRSNAAPETNGASSAADASENSLERERQVEPTDIEQPATAGNPFSMENRGEQLENAVGSKEDVPDANGLPLVYENDECEQAVDITVNSPGLNWSTRSASSGSTCRGENGPSLWFRFVGTGKSVRIGICDDDESIASSSVWNRRTDGACSDSLQCALDYEGGEKVCSDTEEPSSVEIGTTKGEVIYLQVVTLDQQGTTGLIWVMEA